MKTYFDKSYQSDIASQYDENEINYYLQHIASIQNIFFTNFKTNCILSGCEVYPVDKTNNNLIFYIYPGKFLTNIVFSSIDVPVTIDTQESITSLTTGVLLNTDGKKVRCFLVDVDRIWNPDDEDFNSNHLILAFFQLIHYQNKFRAYSTIFNNNYLKILEDLNIDYDPRVSEIGFSSQCENASISISEINLSIRPLLIISEQNFNRKFQQYLIDTYPQSTSNRLIPDVPTYLTSRKRITSHLSVFDGFYNDFYC